MTGQTIGYARVSTADQNLDRQLEAIGEVDRMFSEKVSGGSRDGRDQLREMIAYARAGDTVKVASMDRLGRDVDDLKAIIRELNDKGVNVHLLKENLRFVIDGGETDRAMTDLMLHLLGGVAQFERARIRERQAEGIALAKERGAYKGRKRALTNEQVAEATQRRQDGDSMAQIARDLGVSRQTLYTALKAA